MRQMEKEVERGVTEQEEDTEMEIGEAGKL